METDIARFLERTVDLNDQRSNAKYIVLGLGTPGSRVRQNGLNQGDNDTDQALLRGASEGQPNTRLPICRTRAPVRAVYTKPCPVQMRIIVASLAARSSSGLTLWPQSTTSSPHAPRTQAPTSCSTACLSFAYRSFIPAFTTNTPAAFKRAEK